MSISVGLLMAITMLLTLCVVAVIACVIATGRLHGHHLSLADKVGTIEAIRAQNARLMDEFRQRLEGVETRLSNFHLGLNSTNERFGKAMGDMDQLDTELRDALNHFDHRLNHLHNSQSALCHELGVQLPELPKAPDGRVLTP